MQNYTTIIGIIELRLQKIGYETTQKRYGVGSSTVTLVMKRFRELGVSLEELKAMPPKDVEEAFYPPENLRRTAKPQPDFFKIHARMAAMEHPNLAFLWLETKRSTRTDTSSPNFMSCTGRFSLRTMVRHPLRCRWSVFPESACTSTGWEISHRCCWSPRLAN